MKAINRNYHTEEKTTVNIGNTITYLDENDKPQKSVVTESNLNWVRKNIGERVFRTTVGALLAQKILK